MNFLKWLFSLGLILLSNQCNSYEIIEIPLQEKRTFNQSTLILIGGFQVRNSAGSGISVYQARDALELALLEQGFRVVANEKTSQLLKDSKLDMDKELSNNELLLLAPKMPGRVWIQGTLDIQRTYDLAEDKWQLSYRVRFIDIQTGTSFLETKVFGNDLDYVRDRELFEASRKMSDSLTNYLSN